MRYILVYQYKTDTSHGIGNVAGVLNNNRGFMTIKTIRDFEKDIAKKFNLKNVVITNYKRV